MGIPKLPVLLALAEVLRVRDLAALTGETSLPVELFVGPGHDRLPAVRAAIDLFPVPVVTPAPTAARLRVRLGQAWAARHAAPNHREVIGALLPDLIQDAQAVVRLTDRAEDRRAAQAVLAQVYCLAQFFIAYQPAQDLLWRVVERSMVAAQESEDPRAIGVAAWLAAQAHRDAGGFDAADAVTMRTLEFLEPLLPDANAPTVAAYGALQFEAGYTAARRGETGASWGYWDSASAVARRLPEDYYDPITSFGTTIMAAHAVTVAVELRAGGESARQATAADAGAIPSRPRRARHRIEQARAYHLNAQPDAAVEILAQAHAAAPETVRYNGYAKRILLEEVQESSPARRRRASDLAVKIGLLTA